MTSEEVDTRLSDPSQALPSEMLCHLLSSLGPQSIAKSSAVSRAWRDLINSDSTLHREVDLLKVYRQHRILDHLNRLSSLAHHKLWKLSLDLTRFCERFHGRDDRASVEERAVKLDDVLEVVQLSRETLCYLTFHIDFDRNYGPSKDGLPFIRLFLPDLFKFPRLDHISIEASSFIGIESGDDRQGHKSFKLNDISEDEDEEEEWGRETAVDQRQFALERIKFMKRVRKFTGSGLTKIQGERWVWPVLLEFMKELIISTSTLQTINLDGFDFDNRVRRGQLWNFAIVECPKLESFRLYGPRFIYPDDSSYEPSVLERIKLSRDPNKLKLDLLNFDLQWLWEPMARLIGDRLEEFSFKLFNTLRTGPGFFQSGLFNSLLLPFKDSLRVLELEDIDCRQDTDPNLQNTLIFSNLELLSFKSVQASVLNLGSRIRSPKLDSIKLQDGAHPTKAIQCLIALLKSHNSIVTWVHFSGLISKKAAPQQVNLSLPNLKVLQFYAENEESLESLLSGFECPSLVELSPLHLKNSFKSISPKVQSSSGSWARSSPLVESKWDY